MLAGSEIGEFASLSEFVVRSNEGFLRYASIIQNPYESISPVPFLVKKETRKKFLPIATSLPPNLMIATYGVQWLESEIPTENTLNIRATVGRHFFGQLQV